MEAGGFLPSSVAGAAACVCAGGAPGVLLLAEEPMTQGVRLTYIAVSCMLVLLAGLVSGLTLGLMSIDAMDLEVLKRSGTPKEKHYAQQVAGVLSRPHLLLVTLLICNAVCAEALPIFLDRLLSPVAAIIISVSVILFFGEIIPQAICSKHGLAVGAKSAWLVRVLIALCWVVAYPISRLLDWMLGHEHVALFRRPQLKALVDFLQDREGASTITAQEAQIIAGVLDLATKTAKQSMTPLDKVFSLPEDAVLDEETLRRVLESGHSRVPVFRKGNRADMAGLLLVKELVLLDPEDCVPVKEVLLG